MSNLEKAISVALNAHAGQVDKAGCPYILHPLRLMLKFEMEQERIAAVLHDVVEDSDITLDNLSDIGFSKLIIEAVDHLTKMDGEDYNDFINRLSGNELARKIKIEGLKDNLNVTRIESLSSKDLARVERYHKALKFLLKQ